MRGADGAVSRHLEHWLCEPGLVQSGRCIGNFDFKSFAGGALLYAHEPKQSSSAFRGNRWSHLAVDSVQSHARRLFHPRRREPASNSLTDSRTLRRRTLNSISRELVGRIVIELHAILTCRQYCVTLILQSGCDIFVGSFYCACL